MLIIAILGGIIAEILPNKIEARCVFPGGGIRAELNLGCPRFFNGYMDSVGLRSSDVIYMIVTETSTYV